MKMRGKWILPAIALALLNSCTESTQPDVATVEIVASRNQVVVGGVLELSARAVNSEGQVIDDQHFAWTSSDSSVASVNGAGEVTGKAPGKVTVTAIFGKARGTVALTVLADPVTEVAVTPAVRTIAVSEEMQLTATALDATGAELEDRVITWSSGDQAVVTVSSTGLATGRAVGTAVITATSEGVTDSATITVTSVPSLRLELVASGVAPGPVYLTSPPDDGRLIVAGLDGLIRVVKDGELLPEPFLDLRDRVSMFAESGFFSIAFHPAFGTNGYFYVDYADRTGLIRVERYTISSDPNRADPASAKLILAVGRPSGCHYGGRIGFGPEGKLFIGVGDGCKSANGQDLGTLFGKLLRIDVDGGDPYSVPTDNPFVDTAGARGEIWALGLRNPWRWSIDMDRGMLYIGDVGDTAWEEVNVVPLSTKGANFGWPVMEGPLCRPEQMLDCGQFRFVLPVIAYPHGERSTGRPWGCSVIGGYVYRGNRLPGLHGQYFYGDYCQEWILSTRYDDGRLADSHQWPFKAPDRILSFGEDSSGELYVLTSNGALYRLAPAS